MGYITIKIEDKTEDRLRTFLWKKYRGKGRKMGQTIDEAINEYLDLHEPELEGPEVEKNT